MPHTMYVFDFDGTLFRSPEPNPRLWQGTFIGKLRETPSNKGSAGILLPLRLTIPQALDGTKT